MQHSSGSESEDCDMEWTEFPNINLRKARKANPENIYIPEGTARRRAHDQIPDTLPEAQISNQNSPTEMDISDEESASSQSPCSDGVSNIFSDLFGYGASNYSRDVFDESCSGHSGISSNSADRFTLPLYQGSKHTLKEAILLVADLFVKSKLTKSCLDKTVKLLKNLLPDDNNFPDSGYQFLKILKSYAPGTKPTRRYYCKRCGTPFGTELPRTPCVSCKSSEGYKFFYSFDVREQLKFAFKYRGLAELIELPEPEATKSDTVSDIKDGSEYIRATSIFGERSKLDLCLRVNTDGMEFSESSSESVWPLYYTIVDLPEYLREFFTVVAAVWVDEVKPNMNTFLEPFCKEVKEAFDEGITWICPRTNTEQKCRVIAPLFTADKPARSEILKHMHHNCLYGCETCEIETIQCAPVEGRKKKRIYPFLEEESEPRTSKRMRLQAEEAQELFKQATAQQNQRQKINVKGLIGPTIVSMLPGLDESTCTGPEYMHAVTFGGVRKVIEYQLTVNFPGSLRQHLDEIDQEIARIRPPNNIQRMPLPLSKYKQMKAHQLLHWLLIQSIPILQKYLPAEYFQNWILFVIAIFKLLKREIKRDEIDQARILLRLFGRDLERLYGDRILTYYMHQIAKHLADYVEKWGPLWATSAFSFESLNGFLARFIHGSKNIGAELVNNIEIYEGYQVLKSQLVEPIELKDLEMSVEMLGEPVDQSIIGPNLPLLRQFFDSMDGVKIYARAEINKIQYTSLLHKELKTDTSYIHIESKNLGHVYGVVMAYVSHGEKKFILVKPLDIQHDKMIYHEATLAPVEHILPFVESEEPRLLTIEDILKINPVTRVGEYVCEMPNHLRSIL